MADALIGTKPNQVPVNGMLGSSAYVDIKLLPVSTPQQTALDSKLDKAGGTIAGNLTASAAVNQVPTVSAVASGSTITLTTSTNHLLYNQAATVAALTITLPSAALSDGQIITIATRSAITALTVNGGTIYGAPTTLAAGGFASFIYSLSAAAWFRKA